MWGTVLVFALVAALDPVRNGIAVHLCSRPRPLLQLLAFWIGGLTTSLLAGLAALLLLRDLARVLIDQVQVITHSTAGAVIQIAVGLVALLGALLIALGFSFRRRTSQPVDTTTEIDDAPEPKTGAVSRGLPGRVRQVVQSRSLWVAFMAGLYMGTSAPLEYLAALGAILASGATIGAQVGAVVLYIVIAFALTEFALVTFLVAPVTTYERMVSLNAWAWARRRALLALIVAVLGLMLLWGGLGNL